MRATGLATLKDVFRPRTAVPPRRTYVDFVFGLDYLSVNSSLLRIMHRAMSAYGLSCLLINQSSVGQTLDRVRRGRLKPLVYLDLCSRPGDVFTDLLRALAGQGAHTLCDPAALRWTFKAYAHPRLEAAGLPLPPSVILSKDEADRELTPDERARIGDLCVIKPSYGVAGLGAVIGVPPTRDQVMIARDYDRNDDWLIQKMIRWTRFGDRQAYLRGYNVLGHRTLMWWSGQAGYAPVTWDDFRRYDLLGAVELIDRVAATTGVEFFSSEIAITSQTPGPDRYCLIDYVNDQCDLDCQGAPDRAPPASWVAWVCDRLAEFTWRTKHGLPRKTAGTLFLADAAD